MVGNPPAPINVTDAEDQHQALLGALIGDRRDEWRTSNHFRFGILQLASWLPHLVDAIADQAAKADEAQRLLIEIEKRTLPPTFRLESTEAGIKATVGDKTEQRRATAAGMGLDLDELEGAARSVIFHPNVIDEASPEA